MGSLSIWHWIIVLVVVVLVFGTKKLKNLGSDLGGAIKGFKDGMKSSTAAESENTAPPSANTPPTPLEKPGTIDVQAKEKTS